jgi:hypothetical protein
MTRCACRDRAAGSCLPVRGPKRRHLAAALTAALLLAHGIARAVNPTPVQLFYVPFPEDQLLQGLQAIANTATLTLTAGEFTFCDVKMGRQAVLEAEGDVIMKIALNLRIGTASTFGPAPGFAPVGVYVGGRKVRLSQSARVIAAIVAPNAKIAFGRDAELDGCFCAQQAKSDKHITLTCQE